MARTLVDIDRELLRQAQEELGTTTIVATVAEALRQVAARAALRRTMEYLADMDDEQYAMLTSGRDALW